MTTLSAKADSFSDQSRVALEVRRPRPGLESAFEDIPRRILVSMQGQPAMRTDMPAIAQLLGHWLVTSTAVLGCPVRIHSHDFHAGSFSLAAEDVHETGPAGIGDCTRQRVVLEHVGHIQALHSDQAVQPDQFQSYLVVMLVPQVADTCMQNTDPVRSLSAIAKIVFLSERTLAAKDLPKR